METQTLGPCLGTRFSCRTGEWGEPRGVQWKGEKLSRVDAGNKEGGKLGFAVLVNPPVAQKAATPD